MPRQKPGKSRQDYGTPPAFIDAVCRYLSISSFQIDLAASEENAIAEMYYTEKDDALCTELTWAMPGWSWLNPPFANITPWVERAEGEARLAGAKIAMLIPASVGANWWRDFVHDKCLVLCLNGRIQFVGTSDPYPKDCALLIYAPEIAVGYDVWQWKQQQ
jgi:phage N-6-adenine-methyltransferase